MLTLLHGGGLFESKRHVLFFWRFDEDINSVGHQMVDRTVMDIHMFYLSTWLWSLKQHSILLLFPSSLFLLARLLHGQVILISFHFARIKLL